MKKPGFSLIEIVIAMLVSSFVALMFYRTFHQTVYTVKKITHLIDDYANILPVRVQLEQDLLGIWKPTVTRLKLEEPKKESKGKKGKTDEEEPEQEKGDASKLEEESIDERKIFSAQMKKDNTDRLSFVTTNAFLVFDEPAVRFVRVTYRLVPLEVEGKSLFTLMRDESLYDPANKEERVAKRRHSFPLLTNVCKWKMKFTATNAQQKVAVRAKGAPTPESVTLTEWGTEAQQKKCAITVPEFIHIEGVICDGKTNKEVSFEFDFLLPNALCQDMKPPYVPGEKGGMLDQLASSAFAKLEAKEGGTGFFGSLAAQEHAVGDEP